MSNSSGVATGGQGGGAKKMPKIGEKRDKSGNIGKKLRKRGKIGKVFHFAPPDRQG